MSSGAETLEHAAKSAMTPGKEGDGNAAKGSFLLPEYEDDLPKLLSPASEDAPNEKGAAQKTERPPEPPQPRPEHSLHLPEEAMVGSCGELARVLTADTEIPPEFVFAAALTFLGSLVCRRGLELEIGIRVEPRLYTVLLGESGDVKKSTAIRRTIEFFKKLSDQCGLLFRDLQGVASAEGLARELGEVPNTVLVFDEMRAFLDKCKIQGSALLSAVASLFEGGDWDNATKSVRHSIAIRNAKLSLVAACTTQTWQGVWGRDAIAIGLPNRLLVVYAEARPRVAWPKRAEEEALRNITARIEQQVRRLPLRLGISEDAKRLWEDWYHRRPTSEHVKRLDTIGFRLLALIALSMDKSEVDVEVVRVVVQILDYELRVRQYHDPIDADSVVAKMEESIRRVVHDKGRISHRDLRRATSADRAGIWAFDRALENLNRVGDVRVDGNLILRVSADPSAAPKAN
jgi:hypothetical protein